MDDDMKLFTKLFGGAIGCMLFFYLAIIAAVVAGIIIIIKVVA